MSVQAFGQNGNTEFFDVAFPEGDDRKVLHEVRFENDDRFGFPVKLSFVEGGLIVGTNCLHTDEGFCQPDTYFLVEHSLLGVEPPAGMRPPAK